MFLHMPTAARREAEEMGPEVRGPAEKKKTADAAEVLAASGPKPTFGATMTR